MFVAMVLDLATQDKYSAQNVCKSLVSLKGELQRCQNIASRANSGLEKIYVTPNNGWADEALYGQWEQTAVYTSTKTSPILKDDQRESGPRYGVSMESMAILILREYKRRTQECHVSRTAESITDEMIAHYKHATLYAFVDNEVNAAHV